MKLTLVLILAFALIGCGDDKDGKPCTRYEIGSWQFDGETEFRKVSFNHCGYDSAGNHLVLVQTPDRTLREMILVDAEDTLPAGRGGGL